MYILAEFSTESALILVVITPVLRQNDFRRENSKIAMLLGISANIWICDCAKENEITFSFVSNIVG